MKTNIVTCPNCDTKHENHEPCPGCNETTPAPTLAAMVCAEKTWKAGYQNGNFTDNKILNLALLIDAETRLPELEALENEVRELRGADGCWPWCEFKLHDQGVCRCEEHPLTKLLTALSPAAKPE